ncbi:MDR family MFS transporter [Hwangdonia lutea]|uniref:MFS transporter n=1 Tax=Hwangdonia lutea TaxID=3075823 RepID=A0AA97HSC0_9FLAO|nr:MFS transporter [Hwangdonia sp. SCSIO 19198]WOD44343.1 MFS transporter [Hwangdonia sp. SCSIO 19198]
MKILFNNYLESFKGLSKEIWYLALISLINRAGTMVIPFLSLYLTKNLGFSKDDAGWILVFFGLGSLIGSWLGGWLTDKIGFYKVMVLSLFVTGIGFIGLQYVTSFWGLCFAILFIMVVADTFRPALFVSLKAYSKPENQTRSLALIRLAINLGMGVGPTLAGLIIVMKGYNMLFWIDGLTCITAIVLFNILVKEVKHKPSAEESEKIIKAKNVIYKDTSYWIFIAICFLMGMTFFQLIVTMPIYYEEQFGLNEFNIGLIMFINVAIIVIFEMPFIHFLEKKSLKSTQFIIASCILFGLSFYVLYNNFWLGILIVSMVIITFAEMLGFPYTNAFALKRAKEGFEGSYMALYAMAFSLAHIFSSKIGLSIVDNFGYQINWLVTGSFAALATVLAMWLHNRVRDEI